MGAVVAANTSLRIALHAQLLMSVALSHGTTELRIMSPQLYPRSDQ